MHFSSIQLRRDYELFRGNVYIQLFKTSRQQSLDGYVVFENRYNQNQVAFVKGKVDSAQI